MEKQAFLDDIVFGWIKRDVERMQIEIRPIGGKPGNINFPLALCIFAYLEYLGGFLSGAQGDSKCNARIYMERCFPEESKSDYVKSINILNSLFRNGLVHEYFGRGAISRDGGTALTRDPSKGFPILDVETLSTDFLRSLFSFRDKLSDQSYIDRDTQIKETYQKNIERFKKEISDLPVLPVPSSNSANYDSGIIKSGASLPRGPLEISSTISDFGGSNTTT